MKFRYFFSDFDGTLTQDGLISAEFMKLITILKAKKIELVLVSGRSASWGHFFLTHFPLNMAIMEAGGVILYKEKKEKNLIRSKVLASDISLKKLNTIHEKLLKKFPELVSAYDNLGRVTDRAIELYSLNDEKLIYQVKKFLNANSCHCSTSNVHLNFSNIKNDKWSGVQYLVQNIMNKKLDNILKHSFFAGDAPNDEVMFKNFTYSLGVKNIGPYLKNMSYHPKVISNKSEISGVLDFLESLAIV